MLQSEMRVACYPAGMRGLAQGQAALLARSHREQSSDLPESTAHLPLLLPARSECYGLEIRKVTRFEDKRDKDTNTA